MHIIYNWVGIAMLWIWWIINDKSLIHPEVNSLCQLASKKLVPHFPCFHEMNLIQKNSIKAHWYWRIMNRKESVQKKRMQWIMNEKPSVCTRNEARWLSIYPSQRDHPCMVNDLWPQRCNLEGCWEAAEQTDPQWNSHDYCSQFDGRLHQFDQHC